MKLTNTNTLVQLNQKALNNLTQVVNETIATGVRVENKTKKRRAIRHDPKVTNALYQASTAR